MVPTLDEMPVCLVHIPAFLFSRDRLGATIAPPTERKMKEIPTKITPRELEEQAAAEYATRIADVITIVTEKLIKAEPVNVLELVEHLDPDRDNSALKAFLTSNKIISARDFEAAFHKVRIIRAYGRVPKTALDLVQCYVSSEDISYSPDGVFHRNGKPYEIQDDGTKFYFRTEDADEMDKVLAESMYRKEISRDEFLRAIRMERDTYSLRFDNSQIDDATQCWTDGKRNQAMARIILNIGSPTRCVPNRISEARWLEVCKAIFDTTETDVKFVGAVLKHFIWQVKRKLRNVPVTRHLMPVIIGPQNKGKSTFVEIFLKPVTDLKINTRFDMITDDRNHEMWSSFVFFFDEMQNAARSDIENIKNKITTDYITSRIMRSNGQNNFRNCATFIGTANKSIAQLIKDETGMRRFAELRFSDNPDYDIINTFDWRELWATVDHLGEAPIIAVMDQLRVQQEEMRQFNAVETWVKAVCDGTEDNDRADDITRGKFVPAHVMYLRFQYYEEKYLKSNFVTTLTKWGLDMAAIINMDRNNPYGLAKKRTSTGWQYRIENARGAQNGVTPIRPRGATLL